jgi:hypothetical protein
MDAFELVVANTQGVQVEISPDGRTLTQHFDNGRIFIAQRFSGGDSKFTLMIDPENKIQTVVNIWTKHSGEKNELSVQSYLTPYPERIVQPRLQMGEQQVQVEYHEGFIDRWSPWQIRTQNCLLAENIHKRWDSNKPDHNPFNVDAEDVFQTIYNFAMQAIEEMRGGRIPNFAELNPALGLDFEAPEDVLNRTTDPDHNEPDLGYDS